MKMTNREFAIENAGKKFKFDGRVVTVVGYRERAEFGVFYVIISLKRTGWHQDPKNIPEGTVLFVNPRYKKFWYVFPDELEPL